MLISSSLILATLLLFGTSATAQSCGEVCSLDFWETASKQEKEEAIRTVNVHSRDALSGYTPLHWAAAFGSPETVRILLEAGAPVNTLATDGDRESPLHMAAWQQGQKTATILLDFGAKVTAQDKDGATPVHYAALTGNLDALKVLLTSGAQVDGRDKNGDTPLHYAVTGLAAEATSVLLAFGAQANVRNDDGKTPLHTVVSQSDVDAAIVTRLIRAGVDVNAWSPRKMTPLHDAVSSGSLNGVLALLDAGANVNKRDAYEATPLHWAAIHSYPDIITILLEAGADGTAKTSEGATPFDFAKDKKPLMGTDAYWSLKSAAAEVAMVEPIFTVASGTGFFVSKDSHVITNYHVIEGCKEIKLHSGGKIFDTVTLASDPQNDLALLKSFITPDRFFALSVRNPHSLQDVIVAGFPFGNRISSSLKFTQGIVSSTTGIGDNYSEIQIDAALQPGNSGGPILDKFGNVVAVAVAKLDIEKVLDDFGVIPENINFGVKASAVRNLMEGNRVDPAAPNKREISKQELSELATDGTVFLTCWMTAGQIEQIKNSKMMFNQFD